MSRIHLVSTVCCSLPANGHTVVYAARCMRLTTGELQLLAAHLTHRMDHKSVAMVYPMGRLVNDTTVRQLQQSDHLVIIWRLGRPVTFFFTRKAQLHTGHLQVESILLSEWKLNGERA